MSQDLKKGSLVRKKRGYLDLIIFYFNVHLTALPLRTQVMFLNCDIFMLRNAFFLNNELMLIISVALKKKKSNFARLCQVLFLYFHIALRYWQLLFKTKRKNKIVYIIYHSSLARINYKEP